MSSSLPATASGWSHGSTSAVRRRPRRQPRHGFTIVELMTVIVIIGILVGLLLPAAQIARESARRAQCANNLKQLSLGALNYLDANQCFPPGAPSGVGSMMLTDTNSAPNIWDKTMGENNAICWMM